MKKFKCMLSLLLAVLICLNTVSPVLVVNATESGELSGEIEVIFNRNEKEIQPYIEAFEKKHPNVKVKYTAYNDLETELKKRMESGDYGDVVYFPSFISSENADKYFEPLGEYDVLSQKYNYLDQGRYHNNIVYGIPSSAYLIGVVYNKEVFHKAGISTLPTTLDEFLYAMYLINENTDAIPFYAGLDEPWILSNWASFPFVEMTGKTTYKYSDFVLDVNPFREGTAYNQTMKLLYDLVKDGYTEVGSSKLNGDKLGWWDSVVKMNKGEIGCSVIGTWALNDYKNVGPNGQNIGFMPFPNNIDGTQYVTIAGDYSYAVAKNSDNKEAAKAFVQFMLDESGYAFDHDTISVLKSDPYPECYGDTTNVIALNPTSNTPEGYQLYNALTSKLDLYNTTEYVKIIQAAAGINNYNFEQIMKDWNQRWEASRAGANVTVVPEEDDSQSDSLLPNDENKHIDFSENEINYVKENPLVVVGYHKNLAPFSFEDNGEFKGIAKDICDLISDNSGIQMEFRGFDNTAELVDALNKGDIDFIAGVEKLADNTGLKYSKDYIEYMDVIIRHNTLDALSVKKYIGASGEKYQTFDSAEENNESKTINDSIYSIANRKADFTITNYYSANYYIRMNHYNDLIVIPYANKQTYHVGFSHETNPMLIAIVNKCIYSLSEGEVEVSLMKYMDEVVMKVTVESFIRANPLMSLFIVVLIFSLFLFIFFEVNKSKNRQLIAAKKYTLLATMANDSFFEYNYKEDKLTFDSKFVKATGVDYEIDISTYNSSNETFNQLWKQIENVIKEKQETQITVELTGENNEKQWYRIITSMVAVGKKQPVHMLGKIINIQEEMEEVATYQDKAYRDPLTKLYNREGLVAHIPENASEVMFAVMDMDNFKGVNDNLGHDGGDHALMCFADKLKQHMGEEAVLARYGGDEFVAVLTHVSYKDAEKKLKELVKSMNLTLDYKDNSCDISISVGAIYSNTMKSFGELFHEADRVLYKTKVEGKNNYKFDICCY